MNTIYIGNDVPKENLGDGIKNLQLITNTTGANSKIGISNSGVCVRPAIFTKAVILNDNFFAWEDGNGSRSISIQYGKDIALIPGHFHDVADNYMVSYVVENRTPRYIITSRSGVRMDGSIMSNDELLNLEYAKDGYSIRVDLEKDLEVSVANDIRIVRGEQQIEKVGRSL